MQPKTPLFTSDSQHPPRFRHAVYLGGQAFVKFASNLLLSHFKKLKEFELIIFKNNNCTNNFDLLYLNFNSEQ